MTTLKDRIVDLIRSGGPISIATYMSECLLHPTLGYYSTQDPLGAEGDFTTAPEISQMFGELLGLALAQAWLDRGSPNPFCLAEMGPGRGTLMADLLRATKGVPGFHDAISLHLVEASQTLRTIQTETIDTPVTHHHSIDDIPDGPLFLIANEFFDALPVRQFQRSETAWRERLVGLDRDNNLSFGLSELVQPASLSSRIDDTQEGDIVELAIPSENIAQSIGQRIAERDGVAFIVDYGEWRSLGDTLQSVRSHQTVDLFDAPGTADLTAHVDFEAIAKCAKPAAATQMTPQGVFLERLGITPRAQKLAENLAGTELENHVAAHRRLTHSSEMGTLFKAIALYRPDTPVPPGFAS